MSDSGNDDLTAKEHAVLEGRPGGPNPEQPVVPEHRLLCCIGQGAYGEVWLAQNALGTYRAVKVVDRKSFRDEQPYEREFKGILRFEPVSRSHNGFVDILQVGRNDEAGYFYYVMELADDASADADVRPLTPSGAAGSSHPVPLAATYTPKTLRSELQQRGRLPIDECLQLAISLNLTLGHLHRQGLIHRDIKPSNIIFVNGVPKLADVGLVTDVTEAHTFVGTEGFIPPEGPNSVQADIYSLGKVLYEVSMGKDRKQFPEPFTGLGDAENAAALAELNAVIIKACATDPRERYESTEEMHLDLALLHGGKSVRKKRVLERRLAVLTRLSGVGAVITALVSGGYFHQQHQTQRASRLAAELQITQGIHVMDQGDLSGSLLWFVKAMEQARWTPEEMEIHRFRLGAILAHCPKLVQLFLHEPGAGRADFSPDGRRLLTYYWTTNVQILDVATGEPLAVLRHSNDVRHAAFNADGERVVTLSLHSGSDESEEYVGCVWNVSTGQPMGPPIRHSARSRRVITGSDEGAAAIWDALTGVILGPNLSHPTCIAFSRDGRSVITAGDDHTVQIWNAESAEPNGPALRLSDSLLGVSPEGCCALTARGPRAYLWDVRTGERRLPPLDLTLPSGASAGDIIFGKFSSSGNKILGLAADGSFVQVWDAATGAALPSRTNPTEADLSPDGQWLAVGGPDGLGQVLDAETGSPIISPLRHSGSVWGVRFHPDGRHLATANVEPLVRLWEIKSSQPVAPVLRHPKPVTWASVSPDGRRILTASRDGTARLWHTERGKEVIASLEHHGFGASFSPDGKRLLTANAENVVQCRDAITGDLLAQTSPHASYVRHAEFSPDGNLIVTATEGGAVQLWNARTGAAVGPAIPHLTRAAFASFSPDSRRLATIGHATRTTFQAQVWDLTTGEPLTPPMPTGVSWAYSVSFSPDGHRILTLNFNGTARVWDAHSGQPITPPMTHDKSRILAARFSPNGRFVLTAGGHRAARLWDALTGKQLTRPLEHQAEVQHAAFSPDGRFVITASLDHTARLWDANTGLPVSPSLPHGDAVTSAELSSDGRRIITTCVDGTVRVWGFDLIDWPVEDLRMLAELLTSRTIDVTVGFASLPPESIRDSLRTLRSKYPSYFLSLRSY